MNEHELQQSQSNLRRERARVTALVTAAREFMSCVADHNRVCDCENLNGETVRAWQNLQEVCDAARPRTD